VKAATNLTDVDRTLEDIATRLRVWRADGRMTLQQVAIRSGVAASTIQKVESQQMVPTITVLFKIARGLGRDPAELIDDRPTAPEVTFRSAEPRTPDSDPIELELLTGGLYDPRLSTWRVRLPPGQGGTADELAPGGEVLVICDSGQLEVEVAGQKFLLATRDSVHMKARSGLSWLAVGDEPCEFMVVGTDMIGLANALDRRGVLVS
jgi:transcriptional regulator with XRE-family HTH domain